MGNKAYFCKKNYDMKRFLILLVLLIIALGMYFIYGKKGENKKVDTSEKPIKQSVHSAAFNLKVENAVNQYLSLKDAFVNADTVAIKTQATTFVQALDSINVEEMKNDSGAVVETAKASIADIKSNIVSLLKQTDITEMRRDFSMATQMMYPAFFQSINYEGKKLYLQHCPMAFNDTEGADWLSSSDEIINPYLGKKHPKYKAGMLHCGEIKDSVLAK